MKITPTTLTITQLFGSQNEQYVIPSYQRRYSWKEHQVAYLWDDIEYLTGADTHLLGTIVCLTAPHTAGVNRLELVDGQQRLTTIAILLCCILEMLKKEGETDEASDLERLLKAKASGGPTQPKIQLDSLDSKQFELHVKGQEVERPENPRLAEAFEVIRDWISDYDVKEITEFLYKIKNQAVIIRLDVSDAKDAFKLFETINNRGLRLSPTDIIKNFVLGNAARFGARELDLARERWADLIRHLDGINTETFFRQLMISLLSARVTQSSVVEEFETKFMLDVKEAETLPEREFYCDDEEEDEEDEAILVSETAVQEEEVDDIDDNDDDESEEDDVDSQVSFSQYLDMLVNNARTYREIVLGVTGKPKIDRRLRNLRLIKAMQSYGFLMKLRMDGCSEENFEAVLKLTESFLLRRHICRERTNDNETVFARLCDSDPSNPLPEVQAAYREFCPSDDKFREEFASFRYTSSLMDRARYCLEQIEMHLHGQHVELLPGGPDVVHVEHIIPQTIRTKRAKAEFGDWVSYLGAKSEARLPKYVSRIGNLTLFSGSLNIVASNNPYERKKTGYYSSAFKLTQTLPTAHPEFGFADVDARSAELAAAAVSLWPAP